VARDCGARGYTPDQVEAELERREPESAAYIRPQRRYADIVVRFAPVATRDDPPGTPLSAELLLRPTIQHPPLAHVLTDDNARAMHLKIIRDEDGTPVDCLHVHGHADEQESHVLQKAIWADLADRRELPGGLGELSPGRRSEPLAVTQLLLLYHLVQEIYQI
jgi:phosphoribulokinase